MMTTYGASPAERGRIAMKADSVTESGKSRISLISTPDKLSIVITIAVSIDEETVAALDKLDRLVAITNG